MKRNRTLLKKLPVFLSLAMVLGSVSVVNVKATDITKKTVIEEEYIAPVYNGDCTGGGDHKVGMSVHFIDPATTTTDGAEGYRGGCIICGATVTSSSTTIYKASKISLSDTNYPDDGKWHIPTVYVKDSQGNDIGSNNYRLEYSDYSGSDKAGSYYVKVIFMNGRYEGSKTLYYTIGGTGGGGGEDPDNPDPENPDNPDNPGDDTGAPEMRSATAMKGAIKVRWTKVDGVDGYKVQYATNPSFTDAKVVTVAGQKKQWKKIKGLGTSTTYYFRVCSYTGSSTSGWSTNLIKQTK